MFNVPSAHNYWVLTASLCLSIHASQELHVLSALSVLRLPITTRPLRALVRAVFNRRASARKPTALAGLLRTALKTMTSFSLPCTVTPLHLVLAFLARLGSSYENSSTFNRQQESSTTWKPSTVRTSTSCSDAVLNTACSSRTCTQLT